MHTLGASQSTANMGNMDRRESNLSHCLFLPWVCCSCIPNLVYCRHSSPPVRDGFGFFSVVSCLKSFPKLYVMFYVCLSADSSIYDLSVCCLDQSPSHLFHRITSFCSPTPIPILLTCLPFFSFYPALTPSCSFLLLNSKFDSTQAAHIERRQQTATSLDDILS